MAPGCVLTKRCGPNGITGPSASATKAAVLASLNITALSKAGAMLLRTDGSVSDTVSSVGTAAESLDWLESAIVRPALVHHFLLTVIRLFNPHFLFVVCVVCHVVLVPNRALPCNDRKTLELLFKLMKLCETMVSRCWKI